MLVFYRSKEKKMSRKHILLKILLKNYNNKIKYEMNDKCVLESIYFLFH